MARTAPAVIGRSYVLPVRPSVTDRASVCVAVVPLLMPRSPRMACRSARPNQRTSRVYGEDTGCVAVPESYRSCTAMGWGSTSLRAIVSQCRMARTVFDTRADSSARLSRSGRDQIASDIGERRAATQRHGGVEFVAQRGEHASDAGLAVQCQAPQYRPSDKHRARAKRYRLEHVRAAPNAAVHEHRDVGTRTFDDLDQSV